MIVRGRRRNANVVQHAEVEQEACFAFVAAQRAGAIGSHQADALAVTDIVDANEVERFGERVDDLPKINANARGGVGVGRRVSCQARRSFHDHSSALEEPPVGAGKRPEAHLMWMN